jgi:hypothetical protein
LVLLLGKVVDTDDLAKTSALSRRGPLMKSIVTLSFFLAGCLEDLAADESEIVAI